MRVQMGRSDSVVSLFRGDVDSISTSQLPVIRAPACFFVITDAQGGEPDPPGRQVVTLHYLLFVIASISLLFPF